MDIKEIEKYLATTDEMDERLYALYQKGVYSHPVARLNIDIMQKTRKKIKVGKTIVTGKSNDGNIITGIVEEITKTLIIVQYDVVSSSNLTCIPRGIIEPKLTGCK